MADEDIAAAAATSPEAGTAGTAAADSPADGADGADAKNANSGSTASGAVGIDWDVLIAAAMTNRGAPFAPDVIRELAALKQADRARYEDVRTRLKQAGSRVTELDVLIAEAAGERRDGRPPSHADILVALAEAAELFHTPDDVPYADIEINGHCETWPIQSRGFRRWLKRRFFEETGGAPNGEAVASALGVIEAKAQHDTLVREVFVRVGELDGKVYLDLCDPEWRAVEIDKTGWRVVDRPTVRFRRTPDMRPLPEPEEGGSVDGLRPLLNIPEDEKAKSDEAQVHGRDDDFILAIAFALACLRPRGPYPVGAIGGEQGSAKSTRSALLCSVVDPRHPRVYILPRDERDLVVAARNRHVLAFDNISGLRPWQSDNLCRLASGAGFSVRQLYTDADEFVFSGARPVILNGIEEIVERPDLAERSVFAVCEPISRENRKSEEEVWSSFEAAHASVLGALLDAVSTGLKRFPEIRPPDLPRMADFAHWAISCEPALWKEGDFLRAYNANIMAAVESVLEASPVAVAVRELMANLAKALEKKWSGTASDLLALLTDLVTERIAKSDDWPHNGRALSGRLRRAASFLRRVGIDVVFRQEGHAKTRLITITASTPPASEDVKVGKFASAPSAPSASGANADGADGADGADAKKRTCTPSEGIREQKRSENESEDFEGEI